MTGQLVNGDRVKILATGQLGYVGGTRVSDGKVEVVLPDAYSVGEPDEFYAESELQKILEKD
jgi:hypothetical protein